MSRTPVIADTDWGGMTFGQQVRHLEVEGYVVLPGMLIAEQVEQLQAELQPIPTVSPDYTAKKKTNNDIQWRSDNRTHRSPAYDHVAAASVR